MKNLLVFASGDKEGGGSGFQKLVEATKSGVLQANIVGVISNHAGGGVSRRAEKLNVPFYYLDNPWTAEDYQFIVNLTNADFVALSGWLKLVKGLPPDRTINIHPGPLPKFGGPGMYGHHVHEAVLAAFKRGEITHSEVCMHFVTEQYDRGPVFFRCKVELLPDDTAESIATRVNKVEHAFQSYFTNQVVNGAIHWDGRNPDSLVGYVEWVLNGKNLEPNSKPVVLF
ncbi:phosphoribosylglycinamide formyltransferase [Candidatus Pacearchaeota archaeon]|nr:phosphoribosylglycinamide formyltransferase [Candidatus Pacearchaeota archaeon]